MPSPKRVQADGVVPFSGSRHGEQTSFPSLRHWHKSPILGMVIGCFLVPMFRKGPTEDMRGSNKPDTAFPVPLAARDGVYGLGWDKRLLYS